MSDENKTESDSPLLRSEKINTARRRFLAHTGMYTAGLMGSAMLGACSDSDTFAQNDDNSDGNGGEQTGPTDAQVLTFALNLEYLEAEFYLRAVTGNGLPSDLIGDKAGAVANAGSGNAVTFNSNLAQNYAREIAADERDHVRFLRTALADAGAPVAARPALDFNGAFTAAARAAGLVGANEQFDAFANETNFLLAAYIFEDVGVTAYKGASPFIRNKTFLEAAAGILAAEAYHAGLLRTVLYSQGVDTRAAADAISDARDSVDGASDLDQGISNDQGNDPNGVTLNGQTFTASNIVPLDENGIAFSRSPQQVLNVVYLTNTASPSGGFFPNGLAGDTFTTSADNSGDSG